MPLPAGHPPFSSFSSFHGVRAAKPLFYWLECRFVIFAIFVKNPLFLAGQKHGLPKAPFSGPRFFARNRICEDGWHSKDKAIRVFGCRDQTVEFRNRAADLDAAREPGSYSIFLGTSGNPDSSTPQALNQQLQEPVMRVPSSTPTPKTPETQTMV